MEVVDIERKKHGQCITCENFSNVSSLSLFAPIEDHRYVLVTTQQLRNDVLGD